MHLDQICCLLFRLVCQCRHHTCGDSCEQCCPGFVQKAWRVATPEGANECEGIANLSGPPFVETCSLPVYQSFSECNCHGHSTECYYDENVAIRRQSMDKYGNYEGGGVCQNCSHNTAGINCENCMDGYYRPADVNVTDPEGCKRKIYSMTRFVLHLWISMISSFQHANATALTQLAPVNLSLEDVTANHNMMGTGATVVLQDTATFQNVNVR